MYYIMRIENVLCTIAHYNIIYVYDLHNNRLI